MQQETSLERFNRRIKTRRYRVWLGKRIMVWTAACATIMLAVAIPVACADNDEQESVVQVTETPAVESLEPEVSEDITAEPIPEATVVSVYDVPLDLELQLFIIQVCEDHHIEPSIVISVIERESQFNADAIGDNGAAFGLMQIQPRWHQERMDKLGVTDLLDPYQNVLVGIDYLFEMCEQHEDIEMALMAYNAGSAGAYKNWFGKGIFTNAYSQAVLERSRFFREGMVDYVLD